MPAAWIPKSVTFDTSMERATRSAEPVTGWPSFRFSGLDILLYNALLSNHGELHTTDTHRNPMCKHCQEQAK